jgi:adenosine deaminase
VPVTLASDNPTVSSTTLTEEYLLGIAEFDLTQEEVDLLIRTGRSSSFVN